MQQGVVQCAHQRQRPECRALAPGLPGVGTRLGRRFQSQRSGEPQSIQIHRQVRVLHLRAGNLLVQASEHDARLVPGPIGFLRQRDGPLLHPLLEFRAGRDLVHQPPVDGPLALDALLHGAEYVGQVPPHAALVHHAGQSTGTGQDRQQRDLRQGNRRVAVVDQDDVVGGQRQLVTAPGRRAVQRGKVDLTGIFAGILQRIARLVGELAEIHLVGMGGGTQHPNVGACAEHSDLAGSQDHGTDFGMLEPQALHGVVEFDVDADVVGIQLQFVVAELGRVLVHIHFQARDGALGGDRPMSVPVRVSPKIQLCGFNTCHKMNYNALHIDVRLKNCMITYKNVGYWQGRTTYTSSNPC